MQSPYSIPPEILEHTHAVPVFEQGQPITEADLNLLALDWRVDWLMDRVVAQDGAIQGVPLDKENPAFTWIVEGKKLQIKNGNYWLGGIVVSSRADIVKENPPAGDHVSLEATEVVLPAVGLTPGLKRFSFSGRKLAIWNLWKTTHFRVPTEPPLLDIQVSASKNEANADSEVKELEPFFARVEIHRSGTVAQTDPNAPPPTPPIFKWVSAWQAPIVQLKEDNQQYRGVRPQSLDLSWIKPGWFIEKIESWDSRHGVPSSKGLLKVVTNDGTTLTVEDKEEFPSSSGQNGIPFHSSPIPHLLPDSYRVWNGLYAEDGEPPQPFIKVKNQKHRLSSTVSILFNGDCYHRGDYWLFSITPKLRMDKKTSKAEKIIQIETPKEVVQTEGNLGKPYPIPLAGGWKVVELPGSQIQARAEPTRQPNPRAEVPGPEPVISSVSSMGHRPPSALLSDAGLSALKRYFSTPMEILRRIPARYLNLNLTYAPLISWLAPALVSDIVNLTFEEFLEEYQQVHHVEKRDWPVFEKEAREVLAKAKTFSQMLATNQGIQSLLS